MKAAKIIPIHKGDSVLLPGNYRPISLLPIFSKIFERLIYNRVIVAVVVYYFTWVVCVPQSLIGHT